MRGEGLGLYKKCTQPASCLVGWLTFFFVVLFLSMAHIVGIIALHPRLTYTLSQQQNTALSTIQYSSLHFLVLYSNRNKKEHNTTSKIAHKKQVFESALGTEYHVCQLQFSRWGEIWSRRMEGRKRTILRAIGTSTKAKGNRKVHAKQPFICVCFGLRWMALWNVPVESAVGLRDYWETERVHTFMWGGVRRSSMRVFVHLCGGKGADCAQYAKIRMHTIPTGLDAILFFSLSLCHRQAKEPEGTFFHTALDELAKIKGLQLGMSVISNDHYCRTW